MRIPWTRRQQLLALSLGLGSLGAGFAYGRFESTTVRPRAAAEKGVFPAEGIPRVGRLAYVREGDLWVLELGRGEERRLTRTGSVHFPHWSANGRWLAYQEDGSLWIAQPDSGETRHLQTGVIAARWSPRFALLAYATRDGALFVAEPEVRDKRPREVFSLGSGVGDGILWGPDSVRLVVERREPPRRGQAPLEALWLTNIAARDPAPVFVAAGRTGVIAGSWAIDGRVLLYWQGLVAASVAEDGLPLYAMPAPSGRGVLVAEGALLHRRWLQWSPRADRLAYVDGAGRDAWSGKRVRVAQADELLRAAQRGSSSLPTATIEGSEAWADADPAWSPDASKIAFTRTVGAAGDALVTRRVWIADKGLGSPRPLVVSGSPAVAALDHSGQERPLWSRQGQFVLLARRAGGQAELWLVTRHGTDARRVVAGLQDPAPGHHGYLPWEQLYDWWPG